MGSGHDDRVGRPTPGAVERHALLGDQSRHEAPQETRTPCPARSAPGFRSRGRRSIATTWAGPAGVEAPLRPGDRVPSSCTMARRCSPDRPRSRCCPRHPSPMPTPLYLGRAISDSPDLPAGSPGRRPAARRRRRRRTLGSPEATRRWGDLRRLGHRLGERDAGLFTQALALANWHAAYGFSPRTGEATPIGAAGWTRRRRRRPRGLPAHRRRRDRRHHRRRRPDAARVERAVGGEPLLAARRVRRAGRVARGGRDPRGARGVGSARRRPGLPRQPAVAVPGVAHGRLPRAGAARASRRSGRPTATEILELRWFTRDELRDAAAAREIILPGPTSIARAIVEDWYGDEVDDGEPA